MKKELWKRAECLLHEVYGKQPHVSILGRFETEKLLLQRKDLIVHFGFLAKLAEMTREEGADQFIFGNINSSFVAWLLGITPVNPLEPHYYCPDCKKIEFQPDATDGWDLPDRDCACGSRMKRDGHSVPCELALEQMNKSVAFDVNLPPVVHKKAVELLREYYGDAVRIVEIIIKEQMSGLAVNRFVLMPESDCSVGTGDVLCMSYEEYAQRFSGYPHYAFLKSINMDALQRLCRKTNRSPEKIDFLDPKVLRAYHFGDLPDFLESKHRPILPMLRHFAPDRFADVLQVYGFRHATGAWEDNGDALVRDGIAKPNEVIAFSENVYTDVLKKLQSANITGTGLPLKIMKEVRLGHFWRYGMPKDIENTLRQLGFPAWYIGSMKKICYLFPKGHAVAYLKTEMRLAWFAIRYPAVFASVVKSVQKDYKSYYDEIDAIAAKIK